MGRITHQQTDSYYNHRMGWKTVIQRDYDYEDTMAIVFEGRYWDTLGDSLQEAGEWVLRDQNERGVWEE